MMETGWRLHLTIVDRLNHNKRNNISISNSIGIDTGISISNSIGIGISISNSIGIGIGISISNSIGI